MNLKKGIIQSPKLNTADGRCGNGGRRKGAGRPSRKLPPVDIEYSINRIDPAIAIDPSITFESEQHDGALKVDLTDYWMETEKAPTPEPDPSQAIDNTPEVEKKIEPQETEHVATVVTLDPADSPGDGAFIPTEADRVIVQSLSGLLLISEIAALVRDGVSPETVVRHFQTELRRGRARRIANVASILYARALDRADKFSGPAAMFYLRARGGWNDAQKVEISGKVDVDHVHRLAASGWRPLEIQSFEDTGVIPDGRHIPE